MKRLLQGIGELTDLVKNFSSARVDQHPAELQPQLNLHPPTTSEEHILPPPDSWTATGPGNPEKVDFSRMRGLLEMKMGVNRVEGEAESGTLPASAVSVAVEGNSAFPPQLPPKRGTQPYTGGMTLIMNIVIMDGLLYVIREG